MVWTGYTNNFNANPSAIRWGIDIDDNTRRVWTVEPDGDETKSQIIEIDPVILPTEGKAVDVRVTVENTELINSSRLTDLILDEYSGTYAQHIIGKKAKILAYGEAGVIDEVFVGIITEIDKYSPTKMTITISDNRDGLLDLMVGDPIEAGDWSDMPEAAIGKMKPVIFGDLPQFRPIEVTEAYVTRLTQDLEYNDMTLHVEDTSSFASSGSLIVEREEIAYTSKTSTTFVLSSWVSGRGIGSTDAEFHKIGARVYEKKTVRFLVSEHTSTIGNIYGYDPDTDSYTDITSSATKVTGPPSSITFPQMPRFEDYRVELRGIAHGTYVNPSSLSQTNPTVTNPANMRDGSNSTFGTLQNPGGGTPLAQADGMIYPANNVPSDARVQSISVYGLWGGASDTVGFEVDIQLDPGGGNQETLTYRFNVQTSKQATSSISMPVNAHTAATFTANPPNITVRTDRDTANGLVTIYMIQAIATVATEEEIVDYVERPFHQIMCAVTGLQNATNNAGSIIDDILRSTSFTSAGLAAGDVNSTAITNLNSARSSAKYSGAIIERASARDVLAQIMQDMVASYFWDRARKFYPYAWKNTGSVDRTLTDEDIFAARLIQGRRRPNSEIINRNEKWTDFNWFQETFSYSGWTQDPWSQATYGVRLATHRAKWVRDSWGRTYLQAMRHAWPYDLWEIDLPMEHIDLERRDIVALDAIHPIFNQLTDGDVDKAEILEVRIDPMRNRVTLLIEWRAW